MSHRGGKKKKHCTGAATPEKKKLGAPGATGGEASLQMERQETPFVVNHSSSVLMQHIKIPGKYPTKKKKLYRKKQWAVLFTLHLVQARMATCPLAKTNQGKKILSQQLPQMEGRSSLRSGVEENKKDDARNLQHLHEKCKGQVCHRLKR